MFFFFFQAEDGIRDKLVTGVQTCALPISQVTRSGNVLRIHMQDQGEQPRIPLWGAMTLYVCAGLLWLWGVEWLLAHLQIPPEAAAQRRMLSSVTLVLVTAVGGGWLLWRMRRGERTAH